MKRRGCLTNKGVYKGPSSGPGSSRTPHREWGRRSTEMIYNAPQKEVLKTWSGNHIGVYKFSQGLYSKMRQTFKYFETMYKLTGCWRLRSVDTRHD